MNLDIKEPWQESIIEELNTLKRKYIKLIEYLHSESFYTLSLNNKKLLNNLKILIEAYIKILSTKLYDNVDTAFIADYSWIEMLSGIFKPSFDISSLSNSLASNEQDNKLSEV